MRGAAAPLTAAPARVAGSYHARYFFLRGSSSGFTKRRSVGPTPWT